MNNLLYGSLTSLTPAPGITDTAPADDSVKSIAESANAAWNQAFNAKNMPALAALYTENAILSPGNGKTIVGHDAIEQLFKSFVDSGVHHHTLEIIETGGNENLIYQVSRWSANGAEANGHIPAFGGITMSALEKTPDGKWLARSHVWNAGN